MGRGAHRGIVGHGRLEQDEREDARAQGDEHDDRDDADQGLVLHGDPFDDPAGYRATPEA